MKAVITREKETKKKKSHAHAHLLPLAMGRKRKNDATTIRTTHPQPLLPHTRAVAMHLTPSGCIGHSTTYVAVDPRGRSIRPEPTVQDDGGEVGLAADLEPFEITPDADADEATNEETSKVSGGDKARLLAWVTQDRQTYLEELI